MIHLEPLPILDEEDFETWNRYSQYPELRWVFNKMEVAIRQGLHCGPVGTAPSKEGYYISRPIYNVFGMGISAEKFYYKESMEDQMVNHDHLKPGHFWCEWIDGPQYSADYRLFNNGEWHCVSYTTGKHYSDDNLIKFQKWIKLDPSDAPPLQSLPVYPDHPEITAVNIETRQDKVLEIHLRLGNHVFDHLPVGTEIIPVWEDMWDEIWQETCKKFNLPPNSEYMSTLEGNIYDYNASGNISDIRHGYFFIKPEQG